MRSIVLALVVASIPFASGALAQEQPPAEAPANATTAKPPAEAEGDGDEAADAAAAVFDDTPVDPASLAMPNLDFASTPEIVADFDKYFYFHREGVTFVEALADVKECDALSSGISFYGGAADWQLNNAVMQYGAAGAIGGAIGSALADAIFGSAQRRKIRRINIRNCMGFKGYKRYGLAGDLWKEFNFEEGNGRKKEDVRVKALQLQALVASGPKPAAKELGL